jgi:acetyltransferase-like isoleucine patch superfamily enzyme
MIEIGLYSRGFIPINADKFTKIGRYCSISRRCTIMNRNHPISFKSMHGFFFNRGLKYVKEDKVEFIPLEIGNDVWIGANSTILPRVRSIGTGAVIGAGTVVTKDVPPYAIVVGNPGKIIKYRFAPRTIEKLLASKWWEKSIQELNLEEFTRPYDE